MTWVARALHVLPLLIAGVWVLISLALSLLGGECRGDWLDGGLTCNDLGQVQFDGFWIALTAVLISVPIWAIWLVASGVRFVLGRRGPKSS